MTNSVSTGMMKITDDELAHYGVLGMKWGKRKAGKGGSVKKRKTNPVKKMTDEQLRTKLNRMRMEQEYKKLSKADIANGQRKAQSVLKTVGKLTVKSVAIAGVFGGAKYLGKRYKLTDKQTLNLDRTMQIAKILGEW